MMTMIQINSAPLRASIDENRVYTVTTYAVSYDINYAWNKFTYSGLDNDTKSFWLDSISLNKKNKEEVSIISEWIVPVTVTAGIGGLVYALYHYRGR